MYNDEIYNNLATLGITREQGEIYSLLLAEGSLTASSIAAKQGSIVNSVYRSMNALVEMGLVIRLETRPYRFQAITPSSGITRLAEVQASRIKTLSQEIIGQLPLKENINRLNMELLTGRKALFERFVDFAKEANREILVISIGEPVPEAIWQVTQEALSKGVKPLYLFHKYDKDNILLVKRWLAMGVKLRHLPGEGYHLNIFDQSAAILSASNPQQTKERSGVVIYNEAIIEVLRSYFFQQWSLATPI